MGTAGRYTIELFQLGGAGAGMEVVLDANDRLDAARALYKIAVAQYPGRLIMVCERARVLARSDRPDSPWTIEDDGSCFIVRDINGQALAYVYYEDEPGRRSAAKLLASGEARRIAVDIARLPELLQY